MESVIEEYIKQFCVVLVTGPRQIRKITLLQYVCHDFDYFTFANPVILTEVAEETNLFLKN